MALLQNVIARGTHAARPAAGSAGVIYIESDTGRIYRDNGASWDCLDQFATKGDLLVFDGTNVVRVGAGSNTQVLTADSTQTAGIKWAAPAGTSGLYSAYLCYQDQKAQNTAGGTFSSGAWRTRDLNTEVADTGSHGSVASNQITLDAGTYLVRANAPVYATGRHQLRLQNTSDAATLVIGGSTETNASSQGGVAHLAGRFTIAGSKVIELQHQAETSGGGTSGFGIACNFGTEVYATLELWKE